MDAREKDRRIVGYIRDIHETKMRELEQERKQQMDPVTSFYRLKTWHGGNKACTQKVSGRNAGPCGYLPFYNDQP